MLFIGRTRKSFFVAPGRNEYVESPPSLQHQVGEELVSASSERRPPDQGLRLAAQKFLQVRSDVIAGRIRNALVARNAKDHSSSCFASRQ